MIFPQAAHDADPASDCRCAHSTPLLRPVVPEVNRTSEMSSGRTAAARASAAARAGVSAVADKFVPRPVVRLDRDPHDVPQIRQCRAVEVADPVGSEERPIATSSGAPVRARMSEASAAV